MDSPEACLPFLKWPGGKRWAAPKIVKIINDHLSERGTYYEPFLGGGAVFFLLRPASAFLGDINPDLVNAYVTVRDTPTQLLREVRKIPVTEKDYYRIRKATPRSSLKRAAHFLYLNRTAYGGIYRLNLDGHFNVPYGGGERTPAILWEEKLVESASAALVGVKVKQCDFAKLIRRAGPGDVVYCDPTYTVAHDNNGFVRYNESNFSWADQVRLALETQAAATRGATVIVSNAHHRTVRALYPGSETHTLRRTSCVSAVAEARKSVAEYLLVLQPSSSISSSARG